MAVINGKRYNTNSNAARLPGVSTKTVKSYIAEGIVTYLPTVRYGLCVLKHFPAGHMGTAKVIRGNYCYVE